MLSKCLEALVLLLAFASFGCADVEFVVPAAGANLSAGLIDVRWKDSGIKPSILELTGYTLVLMVGGDRDDDMQPLSTFASQGIFSTGNAAQGSIGSGIAAAVENGFFFRMTSTKQSGGVVINYSDRFSIPELTGTTSLNIKNAVQALKGDTQGPPSAGNDAPPTSSSTTISSSIPTSTATASPTLQPSSSPTQDPPDDLPLDPTSPDHDPFPLSPGAKAGLAIGIIAAVALLAALGSIFYFRRRRRQNEAQRTVAGPPYSPSNASELSAETLVRPKAAWTHHSELSSESMVHEAGEGERRPELEGGVFRAELEGCSPIREKM